MHACTVGAGRGRWCFTCNEVGNTNVLGKARRVPSKTAGWVLQYMVWRRRVGGLAGTDSGAGSITDCLKRKVQKKVYIC